MALVGLIDHDLSSNEKGHCYLIDSALVIGDMMQRRSRLLERFLQSHRLLDKISASWGRIVMARPGDEGWQSALFSRDVYHVSPGVDSSIVRIDRLHEVVIQAYLDDTCSLNFPPTSGPAVVCLMKGGHTQRDQVSS